MRKCNIRKWIEEHMILSWGISSIVFAFITHCFFSEPAQNEWFEAKWGAGDILTYVSTISLGLLAVWQNKKFKEESDESQERMEKLAAQANEQTVVNKVIEHESAKISQLKLKSRNFIDSCNSENAHLDIVDVANQPDDFKKIYVKIKMDNRCYQVRYWGTELLQELELYNNDEKAVELSNLISEYSKATLAVLKEIRTISIQDSTYLQKKELEKQIVPYIFSFISSKERLLNRVMYGNLSLAQIKEIYGEFINENTEVVNNQY